MWNEEKGSQGLTLVPWLQFKALPGNLPNSDAGKTPEKPESGRSCFFHTLPVIKVGFVVLHGSPWNGGSWPIVPM